VKETLKVLGDRQGKAKQGKAKQGEKRDKRK
jgi:hypothetical protein